MEDTKMQELVAKITREVMKELGEPSQAKPGRLPVVEQGVDTSAGICQQKISGECVGLGCCAQEDPDSVRAILESGAQRVGNALGSQVGASDIAARIDHTLLKPDATREEVLRLCDEARRYKFASVCVNPAFVATASEALYGSGVLVCTVVGFPLGATTTVTKVAETRDALANGADEIDMVINIGALKNGQDQLVEEDIQGVVRAASGKVVKTILETALLSNEEIVKSSLMAKRAGADFVKTSTGFGPGGAKIEDVQLMRQTVGPYMGVKASGGVRDRETAQEMIRAGATRIGASASVKIVKGESGGEGY